MNLELCSKVIDNPTPENFSKIDWEIIDEISPEEAQMLLNVIITHRDEIESFRLVAPKISAKSYLILLSGLSQLNSLKMLDLYATPLHIAITETSSFLSLLFKNNPLQEVQLSLMNSDIKSKLLPQSLFGITTLQKVSLYNFDLNQIKVPLNQLISLKLKSGTLGNFLGNFTDDSNIKIFELANYLFSASDLSLIYNVLAKKQIEHFSCANCNITDTIASELLNVLKMCNNLQSLNLQQNKMTSTAIEKLLTLIKNDYLPTLRQVNLRHNLFDTMHPSLITLMKKLESREDHITHKEPVIDVKKPSC